MNEEQRAIYRRLGNVTFPYASYDKRFYRNIGPSTELSEKQAAYLLKLDHRYRRQTGGAHSCTDVCATYGRRKTGECFDAPLPEAARAKNDRKILASLGIRLEPWPELPLFDSISEAR